MSRFYERELGSKGWVSGWSIGNDPGELNALWRKGDLVFQLTAYGSDYDSVAAQTAKAAGYPTGYTAIVQFDPTSTPTR